MHACETRFDMKLHDVHYLRYILGEGQPYERYIFSISEYLDLTRRRDRNKIINHAVPGEDS